MDEITFPTLDVTSFDAQPGDVGYLVLHLNLATGSKSYSFEREIPRANLSGEAREQGWIGSIDDHSQTVLGRVTVDEVIYSTRRRDLTAAEAEAEGHDVLDAWLAGENFGRTYRDRTGSVRVRGI